MAAGAVGVPRVLHCFAPAVASSMLGPGCVMLLYIPNTGLAVGQAGSVGEKTQKLTNVRLFVTEKKKKCETK